MSIMRGAASSVGAIGLAASSRPADTHARHATMSARSTSGERSGIHGLQRKTISRYADYRRPVRHRSIARRICLIASVGLATLLLVGCEVTPQTAFNARSEYAEEGMSLFMLTVY